MNDLNIQIADMMRRLNEQRQAQEDNAKKELAPHLDALIKKGVRYVAVDYSGYGDSGGIDSVSYLDEHSKPVDVGSDEANRHIEDYVYTLLPAGFEINDGGQGTVTLDLVKRGYTMEHGQNYTETTSSTMEGEF